MKNSKLQKGMFLSVLLSISCAIVAQTTHEHVGIAKYDIAYGRTGPYSIKGTEKYSYYIDKEGESILHGKYSFIANNVNDYVLGNSSNQYQSTYKLSTNFSNGELNGSYVVNVYSTHRILSQLKGTISRKLTANFVQGEPSGTFNASIDNQISGNWKTHCCVTLKKGKYTGNYQYYGPIGSNLFVDHEISGQLTSDGKLTGKWNVSSNDMIFENDVLIWEKGIPSDRQNIAKQYAQGKISRIQLLKSGYITKKQELQLSVFKKVLFTEYFNWSWERECDVFGLRKMGVDFSNYNDKEYWTIVPCQKYHTITDSELTKRIREIKGYEDSSLNIHYDDLAEYYCIDNNIILTSEQHKKLLLLRDSIAMAHPWSFKDTTYEVFCQNKDSAIKLITNGDLPRARKELNDAWDFIASKISGGIKDSWKNIGSQDKTILHNNEDTCYYSSDSTYIISRDKKGLTIAFSIAVIKQLRDYENSCIIIVEREKAEKEKMEAEKEKKEAELAKTMSSATAINVKETATAYNSMQNQSSFGKSSRESIFSRFYDYSGFYTLQYVSAGYTYSFADRSHLINASILDFRLACVGISPIDVELSVSPLDTRVAYKPSIRIYLPAANCFAFVPYGGIAVDVSSIGNENYDKSRDFYLNAIAGLALHLSLIEFLPIEIKVEYRHPIIEPTKKMFSQGVYLGAQIYFGSTFKKK